MDASEELRQGPPVHESRKGFAAARTEQILSSASFLLELAQEAPHARWSTADVVHQIANETGLARALIINSLKEASESQLPLDAEGSMFYMGVHEGSQYVQIVRPLEPVSRLPEEL